MKKIIMAMLALALAGSAFADTKTERIIFRAADSAYGPLSGGGSMGVYSTVSLGNYYWNGSKYFTDCVYEFDISEFNFASIDSISLKFLGEIGDIDSLEGAKAIDKDLGAIKLSIFEGGTGNAKADWTGSSLTLVKEVKEISINDLIAGVTIDELVFAYDRDVFTFVFSIDQTLVPELAATGEGVGFEFSTGSTQITLSGTSAIPEPSTYAAIFGALALGFVIYRRRK